MDKYVCSFCKKSGTKIEVPYKIVKDDGEKITFIGQMCEECYQKFYGEEESK